MSAALSLVSRAGIPADVWQADALAGAPARVLATGDARLDAQLPGGGWPLGALTEVLQPEGVHSEWRLLLPALARSGRGAVVLVGAPQVPFGPSLRGQGLDLQRLLWVAAAPAAQALWATEQALRCADVDAVLAWLHPVRPEQLRRLHIAAAEYAKLLFVLRPEAAQAESSPAALRLWAAPADEGPQSPDTLAVRALKRRGPPLEQTLHLAARPARLACLLQASAAPRAQAGPGLRTDSLAEEPPHALDRAAAPAHG